MISHSGKINKQKDHKKVLLSLGTGPGKDQAIKTETFFFTVQYLV